MSWMSESIVFISFTGATGAEKTSSFTGPLVDIRWSGCNSDQRQVRLGDDRQGFRWFKSTTHMRTLCLPMTKETLWLHGLTKLDQLVSRITYSPFCAQNLMDEWSNGWPAYWRTAEEPKHQTVGADTLKAFTICQVLWTHFFCEWPAWLVGHWDAGGVEPMCQSDPGGGTRGEEPPWYTHQLWLLSFNMHQHNLYCPCSLSPLIHILEHAARCVCGGEDALVCWNSGCCQEDRTCSWWAHHPAKHQDWVRNTFSFYTFITRVNSLSQQEAAELVFSVDCVLDLHQVGGHAERIVLQVTLTLSSTTRNELDNSNKYRWWITQIIWSRFNGFWIKSFSTHGGTAVCGYSRFWCTISYN